MSNVTPKRMGSGSTLLVSVDGKMVPLISAKSESSEPKETKNTESETK